MTGSVAGILYAYAVRFLGPAYQAVDASYAKVSPTMTQSALALGATPRQVLTRVHLPLIRPGVAVALVLVAVDAVKELPIVLLLRPFGFTTVSVWVYQLAAENFWSLAALPALLIVLLALVPVVLLFRQVRAADDAGAPATTVRARERRAVALSGVGKAYGRTVAADGVDLEVLPGELVTLIGPSGCGKSTVLRLLAGLERPDSGSVMLAGTEVAGPRRFVAPERRRVGLVFQDHALFPHLTVARNVGFGLDRLGRPERAARVAEVLALVRLGDLAARYPHELQWRGAAAGRPGAGAGAGPDRRPPRRAVLLARRDAARPGARRARRRAPRDQDHRRARDPRPDRGALGRRPGRRHARRGGSSRRTRPRACSSGRRRGSSRPSWATPTSCPPTSTTRC